MLLTAHDPRHIAVPRLLAIDGGLLEQLPTLLRENGFDLSRVVIGTGREPTRAHAAALAEALAEPGRPLLLEGLCGTLADAQAVERTLREHDASVVLAVGGGSVIDAVKLGARGAEVTLVCVPTSLAHDGISSPIASLRASDGRRKSLAAVMPMAVVVDLDVVATAPPETARAGAGDLLSNVTALLDWRLAAARGRDELDGYAALIAEAATHSLLVEHFPVSRAAVETLARGLMLSGLAMATAGSSRPCSGAEHLISHSLDELLGPDARLHGDQVALGTLVAAAAHDHLTAELVSAFRTWALPLRPEDLGLDRDLLARAVAQAPAMRPGRYTILDETDLSPRGVERLIEKASVLP